MLFYNTISQKKEEFIPFESGKVGLYVCGITAYDYCHIGHARSAVVFDVLVRFLRFLGYKVIFVRNVTDVDDKIIKRSQEEGLSPEEIAEKYTLSFYEDMDQMDILHPDEEPKATEHIEDMQDIIEKLLEKGFAYTTPGGDVYFRVRSFPDYGKLSGRKIEELQAGIRIEPGEEKEDPLDFALWKKARPGEPSWPSPWGDGRPGWHIECSAMSQRYLGLPFDIHGGGKDLSFPHHENERAQSMAASGKEFARYWIHNGFVKVKSEKMSKSLGNFVTIRKIYEYYLPEVLRFFLLSKHYRSPLDFTWESMQESEKGLKRIYQTKLQIQKTLDRTKWSDTKLPQQIHDELTEISNTWQKNLEDDLNTAAALGYAFNLIRLANRVLEEKKWRQSYEAKDVFSKILNELGQLGSVLGVFGQDSQEFLKNLKVKKIQRKAIDVDYVQKQIQERARARKEKDFALADKIREDLLSRGIELQDTPEGTQWDVE